MRSGQLQTSIRQVREVTKAWMPKMRRWTGIKGWSGLNWKEDLLVKVYSI